MRVLWTTEALSEREAIWLFLADRSLDFADRAEARLIARVRTLGTLPFQGRRVPDSPLRALSVPDIQYVIHYRVDEDAVRIMHVFSTRIGREEQ